MHKRATVAKPNAAATETGVEDFAVERQRDSGWVGSIIAKSAKIPYKRFGSDQQSPSGE